MSRTPWLLSLSSLLVAGTLATSGRAHIDLRAPLVRQPGRPDSALSQGPCGQNENARDPERVTQLESGQSLDIEWDVYVQHVSYFRISFDADGDDSFSRRASLPSDPETDDPTRLPEGPGEEILAYIEDRTGDIDHVVQRVTLPDVECERCTLQVTQFTYNLPLDRATYHQCADLVLRRTAASAGAVGGEEPDAEEGDAGSGPPRADATPEATSGCALSAPGSLELRAHAPGAALLVALSALARRRAQRRGKLEIQSRSSST